MKDIIMNKVFVTGLFKGRNKVTDRIDEVLVEALNTYRKDGRNVEEPMLFSFKAFPDQLNGIGSIARDAEVGVSATLKPYTKDGKFNGYSVWLDTIRCIGGASSNCGNATEQKSNEPVGPEGFVEAEIPF